MKRLGIVLIISCFLLLSNATMAIGSTPVPRVSIKNLSTTTIENTDKPLIEETGTAEPTKENEITDPQENFEPTFEVNNEEQIVSENIIIKTGQQTTPGSQYIGIANAGGPYQGQPGTSITFRSKGIIQPGATYKWDFGDNLDLASGFGTHPTHIYSEAGTYWVTLTVTKTNGEVYMDIAPVYVGQLNNYLIPYGGVSYEGEVGEPITFDASLSKSTNQNASPLKYRWDFGDGEVSQWSTNPQISHTYEKERVYQVKLEIKDKFGKTRYDVLHADIGCSFSSYKKLFINTDGILDELIDILFDEQGGPGWIFCEWLKVYLYYEYNGVGQTIKINSFNDFPKNIDLNSDGTNDLHIGTLSLFSLYGSRPSPFHDVQSIQFNTDLADITLQGCVADSDDITVCLQFTIPPIFADLTQMEEPVIRVGFHSEAGQPKPTNFRITHMFRPYLLYYLLNGNSQNNNQGMPTQGTYYSNNELITYPYSNPSSQQPLPLGYGDNTGLTTMGSTNIPGQSVEISAQQTSQPMVPQGTSGVYPEQEITIREMASNGIMGKSFSLIATVSDGYDFVPSTTLAITFSSMFDTPFIFTHRKAETDTDVSLAGDDSSSITFSITRKNSEGNSATLGVLISPIQNLGLHVDINRVQNERQVNLNIDNPPDTAVVFFETETNNQQDGHYFYMKNIPSYIGLHWVPSLSNGYVELNTGSSPNFEIGLCDDLLDPDTRLFLTDIPSIITLSWVLVFDETRSVTLSVNTTDSTGLTLNGELKDLTQSNQIIKFRATSQSNISVKFEWNLPEGYFALDRSDTTIDFDFDLEQDDLLLDVTGQYTGAQGEGIKVKFNSLTQGTLEIDSGKEIDVQISMEKPSASIVMSTGLSFARDGNMKLEWGGEASYLKMDSKYSIKFTNFDFESPKLRLSAGEVEFETNATTHLDFSTQSENLLFGGSSSISINNFESTINRWSANLDSLSTSGSFSISLKPRDKYYKIETSNSLELENIRLVYDDPDPNYDTEFGLDDFELKTNGYIWFDFSTTPSKFKIQGNNQLSIENLHLSIGYSVDFDIQSFNIGGQGEIYTELYTQQLIVYASVNFNWGIDVQTMSYGSWKINGSFAGYGTMNIQEWTPGQSGQIAFTVVTPLHHNLRIIRNNNVIIDLGSLNLNAGSTTIKWQRETSTSNGYLNMTNNGVTGTLALLNITLLNQPNPVEFQVGTINIQPGTLYMDWQTQTNTKMLHINNGLTVNLDLIKLKWSGKTITLGDISLKPGQFKVTYDPTNKIVTLNNGMNAFGPICTYEDSDRKVSVDLLNLVNDYSKTMTLKWYEDANNKIIGVYLDTDNTQLVDFINFTSIRFGSTPTGRRIVLGGFKADDFKIMKNANDKIEITGKLYIANHVTFSRLVNLQTDQWEDLDIEWDLQSDLKLIRFESEFDLTIKLLSFEIADVTFTSELDLTDYMEVKWKLAGGPTVQKEFYFDTNNEYISSLSFTMLGPDNRGIEIIGGGVYAENFYVKWKLWPPLQADIQWGGTIGYDTAEVYGTQDGNTWIQIWPFASGSQHSTG